MEKGPDRICRNGIAANYDRQRHHRVDQHPRRGKQFCQNPAQGKQQTNGHHPDGLQVFDRKGRANIALSRSTIIFDRVATRGDDAFYRGRIKQLGVIFQRHLSKGKADRCLLNAVLFFEASLQRLGAISAGHALYGKFRLRLGQHAVSLLNLYMASHSASPLTKGSLRNKFTF